MRYDAFIGGSYEAAAWTADVERTVNWFPEKAQSGGATNPTALLPVPGVERIGLTGDYPVPGRAHIGLRQIPARWGPYPGWQNQDEWAVIGNRLWTILPATNLYSGTVTGVVDSGNIVCEVAPDTQPATISYNGTNGDQLFITSGSNGYTLDAITGASAWTQIAALNGKATMGAYMEGYFLALDTKTSTLYLSALLDGRSWTTGTDFAKRNLASDPWLSMQVFGRQLWLFGSSTSEVWYNEGGLSFPLAPYPGALLPYGVEAPFSVEVLGDTMCWLGSVGGGRTAVLSASGMNVKTISTPALERKLPSYDTANATADVYSEGGHTFYLLHFDANAGAESMTWAWDADTGLWSERGDWDGTKYVAQRHRFHVYSSGEHRWLDSRGPYVYRSSPSTFTDIAGNPIRRLRRAPAIAKENQRITYSSLELELDAGGGNTVAPGDNPQIVLRMSNDGGKTWPIPDRMASAGKLGEYGKRVRWTRLGQARRRVNEIVATDGVPWRITGANLDFHGEPGRS